MLKHRSDRSSIRRKVINQVTSMMVIAMLASILVVILLVQEQVDDHANELLRFKAQVLQEKIEQRLQYLVENTRLLTVNTLMVNALTDSEGRQEYLPPLIENFMRGKDVESFNLVDFDARPIYQSQQDIPRYNESAMLRSALAYRKLAFYLSDDNQFVVVSPIEYYATTQGAVIVVFDLKTIVYHSLLDDSGSFVRLLKGDQVVHESNYFPVKEYFAYTYRDFPSEALFSQLGINLEIGLPSEIYNAPVVGILLRLMAVGAVLILISLYLSVRTGERITRPILELSERVKAASKGGDVLCSPLASNDELEDLARAFDERTLKLQFQAEHDYLTGLPNRVLFIDRLNQAIKFAERDGYKLAVLFVDLDRFKEANDSFGHDFGDQILKVVANGLESILRRSDSVARLGGDEFAVLVDRLSMQEQVIDVVEKIMAIFKEPFHLHKRQVSVTCSLGIAVFPANGTSADELLRNADAAMYKAKDEGRNTCQFYTQDITQRAYERVTLETYLRQAIKDNQFHLLFQPQMDINQRVVVGIECLIRWEHPVLGRVFPDRFISLAEETGLIVSIDRWVLRSALAQMAEWRKQGIDPGVLSLNLSMVQLSREDFLQIVKDVISEFGLQPEKLMFEVTETAIMKNPSRAIVMLQQLKEIGIRLAVDDFGTGHSSLAYLKRLPIDKIKIDRSFIRDITDDPDDLELTRAIISMARSLRLEVIAEGVETEQQAEILVHNGCHEAQGYLYHMPLDAQNISELLLEEDQS